MGKKIIEGGRKMEVTRVRVKGEMEERNNSEMKEGER